MKLTLLIALFLGWVLRAQSVPYTEAQQIQFVEKEIRPLLNMVINARLPFPAINERIKSQDALILQRFKGKPIIIVLSPLYHNISKQIGAASGIEPTGEPKIVLYLPSIMDDYADNPSSLLRKIMHERDHLTEILRNESSINLELETHMQALTTEFVTVPLKEKYQVTLSYSDQKHYDAWVKSGRNEKSQFWKDYIRSLLAPVLK